MFKFTKILNNNKYNVRNNTVKINKNLMKRINYRAKNFTKMSPTFDNANLNLKVIVINIILIKQIENSNKIQRAYISKKFNENFSEL